MAAGEITRAQVIQSFGLSGDDITNLDSLIASYQSMPTNNTANTLAKALRLDTMEDVFLLCETGDYDEAKAKSALRF